MDEVLHIAYAALTIVFLAVVVPIAASRRFVEKDLEITARDLDLAAPTDGRPALLRQRRATRIGDALGAGLAFGVGTAIGISLPTSDLGAGVLPQAMLLIGGGIGAAVGGLLASRLTRPTGLRIARDHRIDLTDYLHPAEIWITRATVLIGLVVGVAAIVATRVDGLALVALAVPLTSGLGFELIASRIVRAPQPFDSVQALVWSDVARASLLRRLAFAATGIAGLCAMLAVPLALATTTGLAKLLTLPVFALLLVVPLWNLVQKPARYSIRRLWPERAVPEPAS